MEIITKTNHRVILHIASNDRMNKILTSAIFAHRKRQSTTSFILVQVKLFQKKITLRYLDISRTRLGIKLLWSLLTTKPFGQPDPYLFITRRISSVTDFQPCLQLAIKLLNIILSGLQFHLMELSNIFVIVLQLMTQQRKLITSTVLKS